MIFKFYHFLLLHIQELLYKYEITIIQYLKKRKNLIDFFLHETDSFNSTVYLQ